MPKGPEWIKTEISLSDAPTEPQTFFYHDIIDCAKFLYSNPSFQEVMNYEAVKVFEAKSQGQSRVYHEFMTGKIANKLQVWWLINWGTSTYWSLLSTTIDFNSNWYWDHWNIIGLRWDTPYQLCGNKTAHAVYMSISNINKSIYQKLTQGAWIAITKIPVSKFSRSHFQTKAEEERMPGLLQSILFHQCMWIVLGPLCTTSMPWPHIVIDPLGNFCQCLFFLVSWIADLKEQWLIAGLAQSVCLKCITVTTDFGKPHTCEKRLGQSILESLKQIQCWYPMADTWQFFLKSKEVGLSGVEDLCWEGLVVDICDVLCVDVLHWIHKFFKDHVMEWLTNTCGKEELDWHMMAQPHQIGYHNFDAGISHLSQWTCWGNQDLEWHILPVILGASGAIPPVIEAMCSLLNFTYLAQLLMHDESTLLKLEDALQNFHTAKSIFITNGSRQGANGGIIEDLNIPKLHMLHHWWDNITTSGTSDNFCTEVGEALHRIGPKAAYKSTNKKEYEYQMIWYFVWFEALHLFSAYSEWHVKKLQHDRTHQDGLKEQHVSQEAPSLFSIHPCCHQ